MSLWNGLKEEEMREHKFQYWLDLVDVVKRRSTCGRRACACILVNRFDQVMSFGYNGVPRGVPHCNEGHPCPGIDSASGSDLDSCYAVHAEINALIQCKDHDKITICYISTSPCIQCIKALMNTTCEIIVFSEQYPDHDKVREFWCNKGYKQWIEIRKDESNFEYDSTSVIRTRLGVDSGRLFTRSFPIKDYID